MADASLSLVLAQWIDDHVWNAGLNPSVLVVPTASGDGTTFEFSSSFSYFQVYGTYDKSVNKISDLSISLVAPTNDKSVVVATAGSYSLSTSDGKDIPFNLDNGYITGKFSFKYSGNQHILATYAASLPYAGNLEDTLDISPTVASEASGLKPRHVKAIQPVTAKTSKALIRTVDNEEQTLFVKYLKDFASDGPQGVAVVTYYEGVSRAYEITIPIPPVFELVLSIDPVTLSASGTFYAVLPWPIGRVKLASLSGSLITGITFSFNVAVANGSVRLWAEKGSSGKYALWAQGSGWVTIYGNWSFGPSKLIDLPF